MPDLVVTAAKFSRSLGDLLARVRYRGERYVITKHGRPVAAVVSMEDYELFQQLERRFDSGGRMSVDE